jgi:hypothetical protein
MGGDDPGLDTIQGAGGSNPPFTESRTPSRCTAVAGAEPTGPVPCSGLRADDARAGLAVATVASSNTVATAVAVADRASGMWLDMETTSDRG